MLAPILCCTHSIHHSFARTLTRADDEKKYIVASPEVIAIDQDPLGIAGERIYTVSGAQVRALLVPSHTSLNDAQLWSKPLFNGDFAVMLFNSNNVGLTTVSVTWDQVCRCESCFLRSDYEREQRAESREQRAESREQSAVQRTHH
jgi:hypothetical protein